MNTQKIHFGEFLRALLGEMGVKQNELARRMGVEPQQVYSFLLRASWRGDSVNRICAALDISVEHFLGRLYGWSVEDKKH